MAKKEDDFQEYGINTRAVHTGNGYDHETGAVRRPLHMANSFKLPNDLSQVNYSSTDLLMYSRNGNPNQQWLEQKVASLHGADDAIVLGSGVGALHTLFWTLLKTGDHVIYSKVSYMAVYRLFHELFREKFGVQTEMVDMTVLAMVAMSFFMLGQIANYFAPKVHANAFMSIIVVLCKVFNILPKYYEDAAVMFNQLVVKNLTAAVLAGIGMALLNLNVLVASLTWQFVVLCLVSVISISVVAGFVGRLFGLYPVEASITAGFCNNSMGGTGNVAVLSASKRMELIAFAQMGNRLGGAIVLIISGFIMQLFS